MTFAEGLITVPLSVLNLFGMWLLARKSRAGWVCTILGEICWGIYGGWTSQYGLAVGGFVTAAAQVRAWWKWRTAVPHTKAGTTGTARSVRVA